MAAFCSTKDGVNDFLSWLENESGYSAENKKTILEKLSEWILEVIDAIRELVEGGNLNDVVKSFAKQELDRFSEIRGMFLEVLDKVEGVEGAEGVKRSYDILINIRRKTHQDYVYSIKLWENKKIKVSPPVGPSKMSSVNLGAQHFEDNIPRTFESVKQKQLDIINEVNPAPNSYNTWIRKVEDIKTLAETLEDSDWSDVDEFNPDLTRAMIEEAIESGEITVYSSYPIEQGVFISPSYMEAESYSGDGKVYEKTVNINDVAWIDPTQGMYANTGETKYSLDLSHLDWVDFGDAELEARNRSLVKKNTELERINEELWAAIRHPGQKHIVSQLGVQKVQDTSRVSICPR